MILNYLLQLNTVRGATAATCYGCRNEQLQRKISLD